MTAHRIANPLRPCAFAVTTLLMVAPVAARQDELTLDEPIPRDPSIGQVQFSVSGGVEQQFETSIDGGGDIEITRARFGIGTFTRLNHETTLTLSASYGFTKYDFGGVTSFGGADPWDDIHTISLAAKMTVELSQDWALFGGPVFQIARESDGNWDDSWIGGGYVGASLRVNRDVTIGVGVGAVSQIQDAAKFFPVILVDWRLTNDLRLTNMANTGANRTGFELIQDLGDGWEVALGAAYIFNRFRLDDEGIAPEGVGQEEALPVWLRLSFEPQANLKISFVGGVAMGGNLELEEGNGTVFPSQDYDPAGMIGVRAALRF